MFSSPASVIFVEARFSSTRLTICFSGDERRICNIGSLLPEARFARLGVHCDRVCRYPELGQFCDGLQFRFASV